MTDLLEHLQALFAELRQPGALQKHWKVGLMVIGGLFTMMLMCCLSAIGPLVFRNTETKAVVSAVRYHPFVLERVGPIETCEPHLLNELQSRRSRYDAYMIRGSKGSAKLYVSGAQGQYSSLVLELPEGAFELIDRQAVRQQQSGDVVPSDP